MQQLYEKQPDHGIVSCGTDQVVERSNQWSFDSLAVGTTQNPEFSRMTVTMEADEPTVVQVCKQLAKLVEVEKVKVLPPRSIAKIGRAHV